MGTTKEKVRAKVVDMITNDLPKSLIEKLDKLLDSGAINFEQEEDNYRLPKLIMVALSEYMNWSYSPPYPTRADKKQIKNFTYFI